MYRDMLEYAVKGVLRRKLRSWLTIIGIVVGIAAVVLLISLGFGLDQEIRAQLNRFGSNYVMVIPGQSLSLVSGPPQFTGALYESDVKALRLISGVDAVSGIVMLNSVSVKYKGEEVKQMVSGVEWDAYGKWTQSVAGYEAGEPLQEGDTGGAVIGDKVANEMFDKDIRIGNTISVQGKDFRVKGIFKKVGDISGDFDEAVYIDIEAARELQGSKDPKKKVFAIFVLTEEDVDPNEVAEKIDQKLLDLHHKTEDNKDFQVMTSDSIMEQIGGITTLLSTFLAGIAAISLIVGGIGIANTMFTAVVERTQEIGIMKSVGANTKQVLTMFLMESALIGFTGGALGALIGVLFSLALRQFGVPIDLRVEVIAFSVFFSVVVGSASGYFPAKQAAEMLPLEALRRD